MRAAFVWAVGSANSRGRYGAVRCGFVSSAAMQGLHLTADLHGCAPPQPLLMTDPALLRELCLRVVSEAGLSAVGELFHRFPAPGGVTGVVLLAESHLTVHTWPELAAVTLDVYVCNVSQDHGARAEGLLVNLESAFAAATCQRQRLMRGGRLRAPA